MNKINVQFFLPFLFSFVNIFHNSEQKMPDGGQWIYRHSTFFLLLEKVRREQDHEWTRSRFFSQAAIVIGFDTILVEKKITR